MGCLFSLFKGLLYTALLLLLLAGGFAGNMAYEELFHAPWDQILGIENHRRDLSQIHAMENRYGWQSVTVPSEDGTRLKGSYIESGNRNHRAVILLHGLYQNRSMCVPYADIYREMGYSVLMVDLRGHGESGGEYPDWGVHDIEDLNAWVDFLKAKDPSMQIGIHGISLGAAMALLYSGSKEGSAMKFYVADSSYASLMELGREKIMRYTGDDRLVLGMDVLNPFFQAALFVHDRKLLRDLDPLVQSAKARSPLLILHGKADTLIPYGAAEDLFSEAGSPRKELYLFQGAGHTMEMATNGPAYREHVQKFVKSLQ